MTTKHVREPLSDIMKAIRRHRFAYLVRKRSSMEALKQQCYKEELVEEWLQYATMNNLPK